MPAVLWIQSNLDWLPNFFFFLTELTNSDADPDSESVDPDLYNKSRIQIHLDINKNPRMTSSGRRGRTRGRRGTTMITRSIG